MLDLEVWSVDLKEKEVEAERAYERWMVSAYTYIRRWGNAWTKAGLLLPGAVVIGVVRMILAKERNRII